MTDLIERLRKNGKAKYDPCGLCVEAADEIERLRLEFYHYENENTYKGNSIRHWYNKAMAYGKSLDEANSEIERLRERLEMYPVNISTGEYNKSKMLSQSCDGIACRDETIKLQDKRIDKLQAVVDAAKVYIDSDWNNMVRVDRNFDDLCKAIAAAEVDDE